ncbi:MAG TPA: alanine racemase [Armatimonadetes bacterium]|nr:alanine racemase [Armatimonadota bacterium]
MLNFMVKSADLAPAWADLNLSALRANVALLRRLLGPKVEILGVVKADAYGHGAVPIARALVAEGVRFLGVACLPEALELREGGLTQRLVLFSNPLPGEVETLLAYEVTPTLTDEETIRTVAQAAAKRERPFPVHLKVDTGMGRRGCSLEEASRLAALIQDLPPLHLEGVLTHFATADEDLDYAREQLLRFQQLVDTLAATGQRPPLLHAANSAALLRLPEAHFNLVRPGLCLYGLEPFPGARALFPGQPVLSLKTRLVQIRRLHRGETVGYGRTFTLPRDAPVGLLPVGYADGYLWSLSNRAYVLIRGQRVPVIGRVSMDSCAVDLSGVPGAQIGDEVVLIGQQGEEEITASQVAEWAGTIVYEVVSRLGRRIARRYVTESFWSQGL